MTASEPLPPILDRWRILALLVISILVHGWLISNTAATARDSIGYARYAWNLKEPQSSRLAYIRGQAQHPGYPLLASLVAAPVSLGFSGPPHELMLKACQITSALFGTLLVLPMFWLGKRLFNSGTGFAAGLLVTVLPVLARNTSDGLGDGPFLFFVAASLAFAVSSLRKSTAAGRSIAFALSGLLAGAAYLVRPEGIVAALAVSASLLFVAIRSRSFIKLPLDLAILFVGFALAAGPYMTLIGKMTNKPALGTSTAEAPAAIGPPFADAMAKDLGDGERLVQAAVTCGKEFFKAGHYGVAAFILIGLVWLFPRWRKEPSFWAPLLYLAGHWAVLMLLGWRSLYISERHTIPLVGIGCLFAAGGLPAWAKWWGRQSSGWGILGRIMRWSWWPAATVALLAASCLPGLAKPLHENRAGHREAGHKLRELLEAMPPGERDGVLILDHYEWAQYHIGPIPGTGWANNHYAIRPDPPVAQQRVRYIVLECLDGEPESPEFDSPRHAQAVECLRDGKNPPERIAEWSELPGGKSDVKIVLFRQVVR